MGDCGFKYMNLNNVTVSKSQKKLFIVVSHIYQSSRHSVPEASIGFKKSTPKSANAVI